MNNRFIEWFTCCMICLPFVLCFNRELFSIYNLFSSEIVLVYLVLIYVNYSSMRIKDIFLICFLFLICLCSVLFADSGYGSVITILEPIILLLLVDNILLSERQIKLIKKILAVALISLMYKSFFYAEDWVYFQDNDINPNTIGMLSVLICMICISCEIKKIYKIVLLLVTCIILINVRCRGASVALLVFLLSSLFIKSIKKNIKFIIVVLTFVGILFPVIYYVLYLNNVNLNFMEKSLFTGREMIWGNAFNEMAANEVKLILGLGSKANLWEGHNLNMHNNFLGVIVNYGIIGFVCVFYCLATKIINMFVKGTKEQCKNYIIAIIMIYISGMFETTLLWTTMIVANMSGLIFGNNYRNRNCIK